MTKARDISSLIGSSGQIDNTKITLDVNEIPSLTTDKIPNLDTSKITTGTFADARIAASNVSQHATSFDDNKIVNDISTLALRQASDANRSSYNTNSQSVDVFQDATGIDTTTNVQRNASEYISSIASVADSDFVFGLDFSSSSLTAVDTNSVISVDSVGSNLTKSTVSGSPDTYAIRYVGSGNDWIKFLDSDYLNLSGDFAIDMFFNHVSFALDCRLWSKYDGSTYETYLRPDSQIYLAGRTSSETPQRSFNNNQWYYMCIEADGSNLNTYVDNTRVHQTTLTSSTNTNISANMHMGGAWTNDTNNNSQTPNLWLGGFRFRKGSARYNSASSITAPTTPLTSLSTSTSATGNFTGTTITAPSSVSSMGAIITYQDNAGTNALNTDIVLQLSADGGSNYSTATLTALPDFSTGIKMAKVNDLAVTAGTQLKYKISFANQSGSKEARIRGVALQY